MYRAHALGASLACSAVTCSPYPPSSLLVPGRDSADVTMASVVEHTRTACRIHIASRFGLPKVEGCTASGSEI